MRRLILATVLLGLISLVLCEERSCEAQEDCEEGECCVFIHMFMSPKCKKLREKGFFCFPDAEKSMKDNKYRLICPCQKSLECKPEKVVEEDGRTVLVSPKCREPSSLL